MDTQVRLATDGLSAGYGPYPCVAEIDLAVAPGEVVALVGPNGAGKTTLLRAIGGLLPLQAGRVLVDGQAVAGLPRRRLARLVAGLPAEATCAFPFRVREVVAMGRHPWGVASAAQAAASPAVAEALALLDLEQLADRPVPRLSAGESQRVGLARVVAQDTPVLLLDEPTSHQDPGRRLSLLAAIARRARARGTALLVVLHDLNLAQQVADRVALLVDGRLAATGAPAEVLEATRVAEVFGGPVLSVPHPAGGPPLLVWNAEEPA